jgi:hypothetical protein
MYEVRRFFSATSIGWRDTVMKAYLAPKWSKKLLDHQASYELQNFTEAMRRRSTK